MHDHARLGREARQMIRRVEIARHQFDFSANPVVQIARVKSRDINRDLIHVHGTNDGRMHELSIRRNDADELRLLRVAGDSAQFRVNTSYA